MPALHIHTLTIVSEHANYDDIEHVARDANNGDARLRAWNVETITTDDLVSDEEKEFFDECCS